MKKSSRGRGAHLAEREEENREDDTGDGGGSSSTLGKRRRTWGRDRRARPPPAAARISIWRASSVGWHPASIGGRRREVSSAFIPSSPAPRIGFRTARARLELPHGARIHLPRCLSHPVAGSLSSRGARLPRRLSPPQRLPRASASAEAPAPLRGRLWPEAKR